MTGTTTSTTERLTLWVEQQFAAHVEAKAKMTEALAKDFAVTDWLFESLLQAQVNVQAAHIVLAHLKEDGDDLAPLTRYTRQKLFIYRAPNGSPFRALEEGYSHEAWLTVARFLGRDNF